ncbi:nitroreductase/quinone reductase family protein [Agromyces aurantiacus]|uniref:Nitroreductase/quinone reductase family protein n=1 Tax=Agromyces aurantiacus TaxID=165814 RepID=A0ABV9RBJ0_9MICO|nr:nitroreductase/quinone reductase family protein [Agromyces aurantiacus]MBM7504538.1 deazaflavin-dependent oxidoreductase (nitroreductase family) [Agromyces aurantiacus]
MTSGGGILGDGVIAWLSHLHGWVIRVTGGRFGWRLGGMPTVELHTVGRRTGLPRATILSAPVLERGRVVLVASMGGSDRHPAWYLNLVAHPDAVLVLRRETRVVRARTATAEEKAELWPRITAAYPGYARYQRRTRRDIPVVVCESRPDGAP